MNLGHRAESGFQKSSHLIKTKKKFVNHKYKIAYNFYNYDLILIVSVNIRGEKRCGSYFPQFLNQPQECKLNFKKPKTWTIIFSEAGLLLPPPAGWW